MTKLKRAIGPGQLMIYGLGSMLGTGVYGLIGKAAGTMGGAVWMAFLVAMVAALLTGISYASLASRYPRAGGAAYAAQRAYRTPWLSYFVGLTILCSGLASIATQAKVVAENVNAVAGLHAGYSIMMVPAEMLLVGVAFLAMISAVVYRGITTSVWVNTACTVLSASGLVFVVVVGMRFWGQADLFDVPASSTNAYGDVTLGLLMQGSILTFFSFLGFEDMLNVAEEVKHPERSMPIGIIGAMVAASVVYMAVSVTAVSVVPWRELATAPGPLQLVVARAAPGSRLWATIITIAAVSNTALVNFVMGSRLIYGMSQQGLVPAVLGTVHERRHTPYLAIALILLVVVAMQFVGDISQLAGATVLLLLIVFVVVNGALIMLKLREPAPGSRAEMALLLSNVRKDYRPIILFLLKSGLRKGGLLIKRDQIDWENGVLRYKKKSKRTGDVGWVPLTARMSSILKNEIRRGGDSEWVFTFKARSTRNGYTAGKRYPITPAGLKSHMQNAVEAAGLQDWRLIHDLRHTAATETLRSSQNLAAVQIMLGHSDISQTSRYAHVLASDARKAMETRR